MNEELGSRVGTLEHHVETLRRITTAHDSELKILKQLNIASTEAYKNMEKTLRDVERTINRWAGGMASLKVALWTIVGLITILGVLWGISAGKP